MEIGYGHEEKTEAHPPCFRSEGENQNTRCFGHNGGKETRLYTTPMEEALEMFSDKENYSVTPKFNGSLFGIHYKEQGGYKRRDRSYIRKNDCFSRLWCYNTKTPVTTIMASKED